MSTLPSTQSTTAGLPTVLTIDGLTPQIPQDLQQQLIASVSAAVPGYTAVLPGSLVEDMSSTATYAIILCDQARVELVNSLSPYGANQFLLNQIGVQLGILPNTATNATVGVVFTATPNWVIPQSFMVSDGTNQYILDQPAVVPASGVTQPLTCTATTSGSFAIPAGTVTQFLSPLPAGVTLLVSNPNAGIPGVLAESVDSYRARVIQGQSVVVQGAQSMLKAQLSLVPGVQANLVSVVQQPGGGWEVIVGGGDSFAVAAAIYAGMADISALKGSQLNMTTATNANPVVITTNYQHGFVAGNTVTISGATPAAFNRAYTVVSTTTNTITTNVNGAAFGAYVSGGVLTPNLRNEVVTLNDFPDTYQVMFVTPVAQVVTLVITWATSVGNIVSGDAVTQAMVPAASQYVNSVNVGQPINTGVLYTTLINAISSLIPQAFVTELQFGWTVNGVITSVPAGTNTLTGDPEGYWSLAQTDITVIQVT